MHLGMGDGRLYGKCSGEQNLIFPENLSFAKGPLLSLTELGNVGR